MTLSQTIMATLAYHDIFDYPLTEDGIHKYLVEKKSSPHQVKTALSKLRSTERIGEHQGYYYLKNRHNLVKTRIQRSRHSRKKYKKAVLFANILKAVPTIRFVAISGALAMQNSDKNDDIDLVIICAKNTLWTTRFLANLLLFSFRRYPNSNLVSDRACLNIFIDESDLKIPPQNLYTAHEICQMEPLWDRNKTYSRFIKSNRWVHKFLPNWQPHPSVIPAHSVIPAKAGIHNRFKVRKEALVVSRLALVTENFLRNFQLWYMRPKITSEKIGETQLFFHPSNTQDWVMEEYQKRLRKLGLKNSKLL